MKSASACVGTLGVVLSIAALAEPQAPRLDALHLRRDEAPARKEALQLANEIQSSPQQPFELVWRAARVHCWEAELAGRTAPDGEPARRHAQTCWTLGDAASALAPARAEGFLWAAQGVGLWARANGVLKSIVEGIESKFTERLDRAIRLDATVDRGAPWVLRGAYFFEVPWPKKDLKRARLLLSAAVKRFPENLGARLYLARIELEGGDRKRALEALQQIEQADAEYDPPSARRAKAEARGLVEKLRPR